MARPIHIEQADIVEAAKHTIQKRGLAATTLKNVATEAGVTQGMVYYHFKTKEELLLAVLRSFFSDFIELSVKSWTSVGDPGTKVASAFDASRDTYGKRDDLHKLLINVATFSLQHEEAGIEFGQLLQTAQLAIRICCADIYESWGPSCLPAPEPLSRIIFSLMIGMSIQCLFNKEIDVDEVYDTLKEMVLDLMLFYR
jgi:AcrR family transcriptional regulator